MPTQPAPTEKHPLAGVNLLPALVPGHGAEYVPPVDHDAIVRAIIARRNG